MANARTIGLGVVGGAATMLARTTARRALHDIRGRPRLPVRARRERGITMVLVWAIAAGVILALGDVLMEQRKTVQQEPA